MIHAEEFFDRGMTSFHHLSWAECQGLLMELESHPFKKAKSHKGNDVYQDFDEADLLVNKYPKTAVRMKEIQDILRECFIAPLKHPFNSFRIQRYAQGSTGISPHRDGERFLEPIAIAILRDGGDFCIYKDRNDEKPQIVPCTVGDVIVISTNIIHGVKKVKQDRYTITSRIDLTPHLPL